ncbi:MAG: hypothetical protein JZD41_06980 [Thermoproteus sp.]|nr:hypothetical protein [Thermoproteus sp.]
MELVYVKNLGNRPYKAIYRILNTLQELTAEFIGIPVKAKRTDDWVVEVSPKLTGAGWLFDDELGKIISCRCLEGICITAERALAGEVLYYIDSKLYDGELAAECMGVPFSEFEA